MKYIALLALLPFPATAWEFSLGPICTLAHQTDEASIIVTYDVTIPEYALIITLRDGEWRAGPSFQMSFAGARPLDIATDQHATTPDGATLTVRDRGFGNVLDGIEFNTTLVARTGETAVTATLSDADPAVQAFRACPSDTTATS